MKNIKKTLIIIVAAILCITTVVIVQAEETKTATVSNKIKNFINVVKYIEVGFFKKHINRPAVYRNCTRKNAVYR